MPVMIVGALVVVALLTWSLRRMASPRNTASSQTTNTATATTGTAAEPQHNADLDKVARIKPDELRDKIARNEVTVIDVRDV